MVICAVASAATGMAVRIAVVNTSVISLSTDFIAEGARARVGKQRMVVCVIMRDSGRRET